MSIKETVFLFLCITSLVGCATAPTIDPEDVNPAPKMATALGDELAKVISPSHCQVLGCVNLKSEPNHFICTGEFSLIISSTAQEKFQLAANKLINEKTRIDFTAEEGFGSQMLAAFFRGAGGGMAAGATGGRPGFYYAGAGSSAPVQFTLPKKIKNK